MIDQLKTIREALLLRDMESCEEALAVLDQLEATAGEQKPVACVGSYWNDGKGFDLCDFSGNRPAPGAKLYAAPVAQQRKTVTNDEQASAYMDARLWEFIDMAGMWPRAKPDPRIWAHVMVYAPVVQQQEPDPTSLLFAVEQAVKNGHCPWEIEAAFDEYEAARKSSPVAQQPQAESLESLLSTAIGLLMGYEDRDGKGEARNPYKPGSAVANFVAECVERLKDWPMTDSTQQPQAEAVPPDVEVIRKALERAFIMGQNYWADADSESYSANKRSDVTRQKFNAMRDEVCAAIAQQKGQP